MKEIRFVWDKRKAQFNKRKHGISFEEARTVFYDENAIEFFDPDHSEKEERFLLLGISVRLRVLVISYCYRRDQSVIRIISARKADFQEEKNYGEFLQ